MSLRFSIIFCVKLMVIFAYLGNSVSIAGFGPMILFFPVFLGLMVLQVLLERLDLPSHPPAVTALRWSMMLMIFFVMLSPLFFGVAGGRPRALLLSLINFSIILVIIRNVWSFRELVNILTLIRILTLILVVIGVFEVITGIHLPNSRHYDSNFQYLDPFIPTGTLYNENQYATAVVFGVPLLLDDFLNAKGRLWRLLSGVSIFLAFFVVVSTDSRLNLLGFVLVCGGYLALSGVARLALGLLGLTLAFVFLVALQPDLVAAVLDRVFGQLDTLSMETFTDPNTVEVARLNLAFMGFEIIEKYPFTGLGPGGPLEYCEAGNFMTFGVCTLHNWPLEVLGSFGIPLGLLHMGVIVGLFAALLTLPQVNNGIRKAPLVSIFFATVIANLTASSVLVLQPIWIFIGLVATCISLTKRMQENLANGEA